MFKWKLLMSVMLMALMIGCTATPEKDDDDGDDDNKKTPTVVTYIVTFNSNGGSDVSSATVNSGAKLIQPAAPTKTGFGFAGWYKEDTFATEWNFTSDTVTSNITLYAKWGYIVTFNSNGGSAVSSATVNSGAKLIQPAAPTKTGFGFAGWYKEDTFATEWNFTSDTVTGNIMLYAKWTINQYTVTYNSSGHTAGTVPSVQTQNYNTAITVGNGNLRGAVIITDKIWQSFTGWNTASNGSGTMYQPGVTFTLTGNVTLYAQYTTGTDVLTKTGPAGGLIFYDAGSNQSWGRYLEAAPQSTEWTSKVWGGSGSDVTGAGGTAIGTGKQNTIDIVTQFGNTEPKDSKTDYAAKLCNDLVSGGYDDWFLPSKDELMQMFVNLKAQSVGGFADDYYWSSSKNNIYYACLQYFSTGTLYFSPKIEDDKNSSHRVRAVRAF